MYILQKLCVFPCTAMRTKKIDRYKRNWKLFTNFGQFDAHLGHSGKLYWNVSDHPPNVNYWLFLFYFLLRPAQYPYTYTILQNKYFMKGLFSRARCWYTIGFQFETLDGFEFYRQSAYAYSLVQSTTCTRQTFLRLNPIDLHLCFPFKITARTEHQVVLKPL